MQHSRSLGSFASTGIPSDTENLLGNNRPKNRSSLDTFIIPGRVRIPSQKTDLFDEKLVQGLLETSMARSRGPSAQQEDDYRLGYQDRSFFPLCLDSGLDQQNEHEVGESLYSLSPQPTPRISSRNNIVNLPRRPRQGPLAPNPLRYKANSPHSSHHGATFDGAHESSHESRVTSTSWSSVSKISHGNFSDVSGSSRDMLSWRFHEQYNDLATKNGLPALVQSRGESGGSPLTENADLPKDPTQKESSIRSSIKEHRQNWFARKLLPRNSAAITYKARTTYRPITRKRSLSRVPSFTDGGRKNILEGKSLDQTCRLGGLGLLLLPKGFAVEKLTLPTCLSAAASYLLQHGVNAPGLFRVSGQTTIVNALYEYYAHQFCHAGSPSKVQATVQPGQLPLHIEYTIPDVASFFKKVLNGFPGGLLGSLELFEAIRGIFTNLASDSEQTENELQETRAKLIALAILSIRSEHRIHLIQAALGLFAFLGKEAEVAREKLQATQGDVQEKPVTSELMGFQSLGVCLGPLLIADLVDDLGTSERTNRDTPRASTEISDKAKKKRLSFASDKLERSADLATSIERANLTVTIMQSLLMIWQLVVKELSILTASKKATVKAKDKLFTNKSSDRMSSGHSLEVSDGELEWIKQKRELQSRIPANEDLQFVVKRKVKASARSSAPRLVAPTSIMKTSQTRLSSREVEQPIILEEAVEPKKSDGHTMPHPFRQSSFGNAPTLGVAGTQLNSSKDGEQVHLDPSTRLMSMGQVLPSRDTIRHGSSSASSYHPNCDPDVKKPGQANSRQPLREMPETAFKHINRSDINIVSDPKYQVPFNDKPLPPLKDSPPTPKPKPELETKQVLKSHESVSTLEDYPKDSQPLLSDRSATIASSVWTVSSDSKVANSEDTATEPEPRQDSRKTTDSHPQDLIRDTATPKRNVIPTVHAVIRPLPTPINPLDDPFMTLLTHVSPKESLIPKPVTYVGRGRQASPRTPSPPKIARSAKRRSGISAALDEHAETMEPCNATIPKLSSFEPQKEDKRNVSSNLAPMRHLSAYTLESLHRMKIALELPPAAQHVPATRPYERARSESPSHTPSDHLEPYDSQVTLVRRSGSVHATLYAQITRLKKQLEQKNEELLATRRSLDAARDTREDVCGNPPTKRGSWNKSTLSAEVRDITRERDIWKQRAEWAERRLQGLGSLAQAGVGDRADSSSQEWFKTDDGNQKDTQNTSEDDHKPHKTASVLLLDDCDNLCGLERTV